ncbi:uncharacterized protein [Physcomitrium patens]|uniref:uncharacterized protein isoform X1 n=1 Tax=Physcomitrium patens TaxID=3218 RepID=UPI003CCE224D
MASGDTYCFLQTETLLHPQTHVRKSLVKSWPSQEVNGVRDAAVCRQEVRIMPVVFKCYIRKPCRRKQIFQRKQEPEQHSARRSHGIHIPLSTRPHSNNSLKLIFHSTVMAVLTPPSAARLNCLTCDLVIPSILNPYSFHYMQQQHCNPQNQTIYNM